jgi:hypothetical protein
LVYRIRSVETVSFLVVLSTLMSCFQAMLRKRLERELIEIRNKPRTFPGNYDNVICVHSATGYGNKSAFNPTPEEKWKENFSFVGDSVKSCWPMARRDFDGGEKGYKYLSGTSIATPVAVATAVFMITYIRQKMAGYKWNVDPSSPEGVRTIFRLMARKRDGYNWISPALYFCEKTEKQVRADLEPALRGKLE